MLFNVGFSGIRENDTEVSDVVSVLKKLFSVTTLEVGAL